jgi:protocatechuate 3,4-dioxygenase beta subunit
MAPDRSRGRIYARQISALSVVAVSLVLGTPYALAAQGPPSRVRLIVGRVIDAGTAQPISGAEVVLQAATRNDRTGRPTYQWSTRILTSADGYFVFRDIPPDKFEIVATKPGYAGGAYGRRIPTGGAQTLSLAAGERAGELVIKLWKYGALAGTVTDEAGEPLVAVHVRALRKSTIGDRTRFAAAAFAITDDRGTYRLSTLTPGEYVVVTSSRQAAIPLAISQKAHTAIDSAIRSISGGSAEPGSPTAIEVDDVIFPVGRGTPIPLPGADNRLFVYPPTFHPSSDGLAEATTVTLSAGEERTGIDLRLQPVPTVRVAGSIVAPAPESVGVTVPVQLRPARTADPTLEPDWPVALSDVNGRFTFPAVPSGDYTLRVISRGKPMYWAEVPLLVGQHDIDGIAVTLQQGLRITGRVAFEGQSRPPSTGSFGSIPVAVEPADNVSTIPDRFAVKFDGSGQFTTDGLPGGRYFLRVNGSPPKWMFKSAVYDGRDVTEVPLELSTADAAGVVLTFTDRWTSLSGVVSAPPGAAFASGVEATVLVFPTDPESWRDIGWNPRRIRSATTGKNGEFSFPSLPSGDYYAVAVPDEYAADWQDPAFMETLTRAATRVSVGEGEHMTQDLRIVSLR